MWFCFNDGFISAVQHRDNPEKLVVRARRKEILENLFPGRRIVIGGSRDYNYRVFISKDEFGSIVTERIQNIDYANFKNSVEDDELHSLYEKFWGLHFRYQR